MIMQEYVDEIKLELTGGLLELEIPDATLEQVVNKALREVQRYIDNTKLIKVPFASCIDLSNTPVSSVSRVFRTQGYLGDQNQSEGLYTDPMYAQQWMIFTNGGNMYNLSDWVLNYASWNTLLQMRNTASTDLAFREDKSAHKLYINCLDKPDYITIEYVPIYKDVQEIESDYWKDILIRLSVALTKIILGRIRSRYKQNNALWEQDGDQLLEEGTTELKELRETLRVNSQLTYTYD